MNTSVNDRELSDDELDQVTGGGPVDHKPYIGVPWGTISNTQLTTPPPFQSSTILFRFHIS